MERSLWALVAAVTLTGWLSSCSALSFWNDPVEPDAPIEVPLAGGDGGSIEFTPPEGTGEPIEVPIGEDVVVTVGPPAGVPTKGDAIMSGIGGLIGSLFGNPTVGIGLAGVASAVIGKMVG